MEPGFNEIMAIVTKICQLPRLKYVRIVYDPTMIDFQIIAEFWDGEAKDGSD